MLGLTIDRWSCAAIAPLVTFGMFGLGAIGYSLLALLVEAWEYKPHPSELSRNLHDPEKYQDDGLTEWTADAFTKSVEENLPRLDRKARRVGTAVSLVAAQAVSLGAVLIVIAVR